MTTLLLFVAGLAALVAGGELLVRGAARLALAAGVGPLVVGLTVVAFGTSAPEFAVSVQSAFEGKVDIAVGNVVGSNILNVLLILGASALVAPLLVSGQIVRQEVPVMIGASLLLLLLAQDGALGRIECALMFVLLLAYTAFLVLQARRASVHGRTADAGDGAVAAATGSVGVQLGLVAGGLVLLVVGAGWLVDAAVAFARDLGVSDLVIGLTIVAAGTSAPEVATSIMATLRGHREIAVGNVIGSNTFNVLGVLGLSGLVAPEALAVAPSVIAFDLPVMTVVALACLPVCFTGQVVARWEGGIFLGYYVAYTTYLVLYATDHDALSTFSAAMMLFVVPLTVLTIGVVLLRALREHRAG
jgi:cation:H+ antiporter